MPALQRFRYHWPLLLLLLVYCTLAVWWSTRIPLGEGPDEPGHAEYALFVARNNRLPDQRLGDVPGEGHQPPLAYWLMQPLARSVAVEDRVVILANNHRWIWAGGKEPAAFAWRSIDRPPYQADVLVWHRLRWFSIGCAALTIVVGYAIGLRLGLSKALATFAASLLAFWPQLLFHSVLVSNDPLLWLLCAGLLWLLLEPNPQAWWPWAVGATLGAALLTKQSAVLLIPLIGLRLWQLRHSIKLWSAIGRISLSSAAIAGWWYLRNLLLYGDPFGLGLYKGEFSSPTFSPWSLHDWGEAMHALGSSLIARFGWMSVAAPQWLYWLLAIWIGPAILGIRRLRIDQRWQLAWALAGLAFAWTFAFAILSGQVGWQARFLFPAAPVAACALAIGLERSVKTAAWLLPALLVTMAVGLPNTVISAAYPYLVVEPQPERPVLALWRPDTANPIELRGILLPPTAKAGQPWLVNTLWRAVGKQDRKWSLFVHLANVGSKDESFAFDVQPQDGVWHSLRWTPDDWWEDLLTINIPADLAAGEYEVRIGWFDQFGDWSRAGVWSQDGILLGDYAVVGKVLVEQ